jgi:hypothetical protein
MMNQESLEKHSNTATIHNMLLGAGYSEKAGMGAKLTDIPAQEGTK